MGVATQSSVAPAIDASAPKSTSSSTPWAKFVWKVQLVTRGEPPVIETPRPPLLDAVSASMAPSETPQPRPLPRIVTPLPELLLADPVMA